MDKGRNWTPILTKLDTYYKDWHKDLFDLQKDAERQEKANGVFSLAHLIDGKREMRDDNFDIYKIFGISSFYNEKAGQEIKNFCI